MRGIDNTMLSYLHTYEAYRIPKGTKVLGSDGKEVVLSEQEDKLVLTEQAGKQLIKDRQKYGEMLQLRAEVAAQETQEEAMKKHTEDQAKAMAVFRSMSKGDTVPVTDENKLMAYDDKLYQAAKIAQALAQMAEKRTEDKESLWDEREEAEYAKKMEELCSESNERALEVGTKSQEFSQVQKQNIVEVDAGQMDFSKVKVANLGSGVEGMNVDLSI